MSANKSHRAEGQNQTGNDTNQNKEVAVSVNSIQTYFSLLPILSVNIKNILGENCQVRVMADSGSESTFISEKCLKLLGLKRKNSRLQIKGLQDSKIAMTRGCVEIDLVSLHDPKVKLPVKAYVLEKLTAPLPTEKINVTHFSHLKNACLADPKFFIPNNIDMILGSGYFFSILLPGQITCSQSNLIAQNSIFGFLISGKLTDSLNSKSMLNLHINGTNIDNKLKQFWELEEIPNLKDKILTSEEQFVETHFQNIYACNSEGRFVVKLPFYKSNSELGDSKPAAISRLLAMERKFKNNPDFEKQYKEFMNEYESLGHMSLVNSRSHTSKDQNFLPHHAVIKPSSTTTKIPRIVFTADIEKMYRQILVADEDQKYQQILWRNNSNENIRTYKLKTVTDGLASASFLATRCIKQIALDDKDNPNLSRVLQKDIYMDDLLSGADTPNNAISICKDIAHVLSTRRFHLRKWNSNSTEFLAQFSEHSSHDARVEFYKDSNESSKLLGLFWNSSNETFGFQPSLELTPPLTKRRILSESSKIFDPLGLLSPCTVFMKIFYQKLWLTKTDWDSPNPQQLTEDWLKFQKAFNAINYLTVPRWVILTADNTVELHGFADASSLAYAAAIYCRQKHNSKIKVQLLVSKTKVAPVKQVSIPRLELCGAHLLSKLFKSVLRTLKHYTFDVFAWTDSKIVLSWLSSHPRKWKTFIANRTSEIMEVLPTKHWRHVPSKENPADIASRGIDPKCLPDCKLLWQGPPWLRLETSSWRKAEYSCDEASDEVKAEQKSVSIFNLFTHTSNDVIHGLFEHYSSLTKIIRIFAYCQRFIKNCKKIASQGSSISSSRIITTSLTFSETKTAEETIIRWVQGIFFQKEIRSIKKQIYLPPKSLLRSLHPFIDEHGLVRVGGRLQNSQLRFNSKHPIILPSQHSISELLIKERHIAYLHAGPTLLAHVLRQSQWIVGSRKLINKCIRKCLKCNKFKTSTTTPQLMGNLPKHRVMLERPFFSCGIDYAGPVLIKCNKGRGAKSTKGYIALFVCLATKAVHIEAVGDLTTDSFIAALRRFSARRGAPRHIYSDNGTNFVGAHWHFIPPSSPHFGGIWESGIRSVKFHLKRVLGETILTFEELTTLLTQIVGLLNSRRLSYVNDSDIECISTLTPSHFLTGDVLLSVPEELPSTSNHRDRCELLQNIKRGFWKKWSSEFISSLQPRKKWQDAQPNLKEDDMVLIKEEGPPGTWPMARVLQVHPCNDGVVRVVTVKTQDSVLKRPVHKLHKLPIYPI
ncbi:integrase catalytic domain-containing protein [Trichonephila clavipes]|nr:integrase catalytic domain-containing protein [Trichonephila clavipes]